MCLKTSKRKKVGYSLICLFVLFMYFVRFVCKNKKDSIFMCIKNIQEEENCWFDVLCFLCILCLFVFFCNFCAFCVCKMKKDSVFMRLKTPKMKKIDCLTFCTLYVCCAFYAFYADLRESRLFLFCTFLCFLCCFFVVLCAFCACEIFL